MNSINELPNEIVANVFFYLKPKDFTTATTVSKKFSNFSIVKTATLFKVQEIIKYFNEQKFLLDNNEKKWKEFHVSLMQVPLRLNGSKEQFRSELHSLTILIQTFVDKLAFQFLREEPTKLLKLQHFTNSLPNSLVTTLRVKQNVDLICYLHEIKQSDPRKELNFEPLVSKLKYLPVNITPFILDFLRTKNIRKLAPSFIAYYLTLKNHDKLIFTQSLFEAYKTNLDNPEDFFFDCIGYIQDAILKDAIKNNLLDIAKIVFENYVEPEEEEEETIPLDIYAFKIVIEDIIKQDQFHFLPIIAEFYSTFDPEVANQLLPIIETYKSNIVYLDNISNLPSLVDYLDVNYKTIDSYIFRARFQDKVFSVKYSVYSLFLSIIAKKGTFEQIAQFILKHQFLPDYVMMPIFENLVNKSTFKTTYNWTDLKQLGSTLLKEHVFFRETPKNINRLLLAEILKNQNEQFIKKIEISEIKDILPLLPPNFVLFIFNKLRKWELICECINPKTYYSQLSSSDKLVFTKNLFELYHQKLQVHEGYSFNTIVRNFQDIILKDAITSNLSNIAKIVFQNYVDDEESLTISIELYAFEMVIENIIKENHFNLLPNVHKFYLEFDPELASQLLLPIHAINNKEFYANFLPNLPSLKTFVRNQDLTVEDYFEKAAFEDINFRKQYFLYALHLSLLIKTGTVEELKNFIIHNQFYPEFVFPLLFRNLLDKLSHAEIFEFIKSITASVPLRNLYSFCRALMKSLKKCNYLMEDIYNFLLEALKEAENLLDETNLVKNFEQQTSWEINNFC
ncbi:hypothetical protein BN1013_02083 [Candidatus Rubidus massiliensis]|nr:hypothetical protein BN1013_02083 [Candidatus Rubidus massiliensis]